MKKIRNVCRKQEESWINLNQFLSFSYIECFFTNFTALEEKQPKKHRKPLSDQMTDLHKLTWKEGGTEEQKTILVCIQA